METWNVSLALCPAAPGAASATSSSSSSGKVIAPAAYKIRYFVSQPSPDEAQ
jgi:hypothetical protein